MRSECSDMRIDNTALKCGRHALNCDQDAPTVRNNHRNQQFPASSGIFHMYGLFLSTQIHLCEETIRAVQKYSRCNILKLPTPKGCVEP